MYLPTVCILAGGLGTRLRERAHATPKALVEVAGRPFLWHQLRLLADAGARDVVICVGHLGEQIERRIGQSIFGLTVSYCFDAPGVRGTLAALRGARASLGERFLVLYGDTYLRMDYAEASRAWRASALPAMMSVLRNEGRWDRSNADYIDGRVVEYDKAGSSPRMRWIDYGLGGLCQTALDWVPSGVSDLADLYAALAREGLLYGFPVANRFYEIGTPEALEETSAYFRANLPPVRAPQP